MNPHSSPAKLFLWKVDGSAEIIIIQYICKNIGINKNKIVINQEKTGLKKSVFYKTIAGLIKHEIIQKTDYQNIYLISKNYLKNGR